MQPNQIGEIIMIKMRKLITIKTIFLLVILSSGNLQGQREPRHFLRAPDVLPGTLPEMRTPEFWIDQADNPNDIILSVDEIQNMNDAYRERMKDLPALENELGTSIERQLRSWTGLVATPPDLAALSDVEFTAAIQEMVQSQIGKLTRGAHGNALAIVYSENEIKEMQEEMDFDGIGKAGGIRHGITVRDSRIRIIPTLRPEHVSVGDKSRSRWDMFNHDIVPISSHVQILHNSASGAYVLVLCDRGFGWIRSENIAPAGKESIAECLPDGDFIVCTGEKVPYYSDAGCKYVSGWLRMGDRLAYENDGDQIQVVVPFRKIDGTLSLEKAWLKKNADVSQGFLPYNGSNVIIQAIKLMDLVYDYSGAWFGRNHVTILRDLFSCFGFELPGNGVLLQAYNYSGSISPEIGKEAQYKAILSNQPFLTIQITRGHSQLYIGEYEDVPYVFDTHGYGYTGEDGNEYLIRRSCIYTPEIPDYMLQNEMTFVKLK
jgi:hypothetical protein